MTHPNPQTLESAEEVPRQSRGKKGTVSNLERSGHPAGCRPIAGMKRGWYYRSADRMVMHRQAPEDDLLPIGQLPKIKAQIVHLTDDGEDIRTEYLAIGKRQRTARILTEDELDRGTWAAKMGMRRPTGNDERHAFARLVREEGDKAPVESARTYYDDEGHLVFPSAEAQTLGYRVLRGKEKDARDAWEEIAAWTSMDGKAALVVGAYFVGPVLDTLDMLAHMVSLHGPGQQGKSTMLVVCAGCYGDIKPKRQSLWMTWNASKQGITQNLRLRGYLPLALDEHSSSGRTIKESSREISQMVSGAIRAMGTADGSPRESDGFWHSVILSSSNEPLKYEGQTEDLASRLQEFQAPFFPNTMVDAEGGPATGKHKGAEHISKRLKRLATDFGGWPLEWAIRKGMYQAENLAKLRKLHLELCAKYRPAGGGVAGTIAELHMAWVVGAHMLGQAIGVPVLGQVAEQEAAARLAEAIEVSAEANTPDSERLWNALDALRIEAAVFPEMEEVLQVSTEGYRKPRGFQQSSEGLWWVIDPVVREAAAQIGVDNLTAALRALDDLGVHVRGTGPNAQKLLPKAVRGKIGNRMHCFNTARAAELFAPDEDEPENGGDDQAPDDDGGPESPEPDFVLFDVPAPGSESDPVAVPPMPVEPPPVVFPAARMYETGDDRLDKEWLRLEAKAKGRTRGALAFGVLGDGWLHLANHEPVAVALPQNVDQVPDLMAAYGLRTLWVHESAALAMGLPSYDERMPEELEDYKGPQGPTPHPWATPRPGSDLVVQGEGLSSWMTLKTRGGEGDRLSVSLPLYDDRFDRADEPGRGGFGAAATPDVLLDAYMVYLLSTLHGPAESPQVIPYYLSPNVTARDFTGSAASSVVSQMVRARQVPPVEAKIKPLVSMQWTRPVEEITDQERKRAWIHQYDKNAAWLAAFGSVWLGVGDPTHYPEGRAYVKNKAGYWRVRELPGLALEGLPELNIEPAEEGGYWLRSPGVDLLGEMFKGWTPDVLEAWVWENSKRALYGMYDKLRLSRERILASAEEGRPGARYAKQVSGMLYQSFRGYLSRREPKKDRATGLPYEKDIFWRQDWAQMILDLALANTYRNLRAFADSGHHPLSLRVDAVTYASDSPDPTAAKPEAMQLGTGGGQWKPEYSVPAADLLPILDDVKKMSKAMHLYNSKQKGES
ncbi:DUF927 domain-containing protein [Streptomyces anulatus]